MSAASGKGFRRLPLRVAAIATLVIAAMYLIASLLVLAISRNNLVADIDLRLARQLTAIQQRSNLIGDVLGGDPGEVDNDGDERRFDAPLVVWVRGPGNASYQSDATALLPADLQSTVGPSSTTIGGTQMRLVGGPLQSADGPGWVTIAQSLSGATSATDSLFVAEILTAPALLLLVFVGAYMIGRRVAGPIERARLAQLAFTADASHELRTPLTVIEAETSLALSDSGDTDYRQTLGRIQAETSQLRRLVDDLLWLARFDSAPSVPPAVPIDLGAMAVTMTDRFRAIRQQRGMTISTSVEGSLSPVITAPPEWIARLFSVLLDNALLHSPAGASVSVIVSSEAGRVELAVEDSGPGIRPDQRSLILNRFHRASDMSDGAGLGLAIADAIVKSTSGHWDIGDSRAGGARMAISWRRTPNKAFDNPSLEQTKISP